VARHFSDMITSGADACDSDALPLDSVITSVHVPKPSRVMVRGDLVDGECITRPSVPPHGRRARPPPRPRARTTPTAGVAALASLAPLRAPGAALRPGARAAPLAALVQLNGPDSGLGGRAHGAVWDALAERLRARTATPAMTAACI
jgi:hypothetical protein